MKKNKIFLIIFVILILIAGLVGEIFIVLNSIKGKISEVNIIKKESALYSQNDINNAIDIILDYFSKNFDGCNLKEISYIGDEQNKNYQDWANRYNKEEVIVLISSFETNSSCKGTFNPNSGYSNYNWILVRDRNGRWECIDQGY